MSDIPQETFTQDDLNEWFKCQQQLKILKVKEMFLRMKIFRASFPDPKEGTNKVQMQGGYVMNGKHTIERKVDEAAFIANRDYYRTQGLNPEVLVRWKPELALSAYRELTEEQRLMFDQVLIIKPGAPALEIVLPAAAKKAMEAQQAAQAAAEQGPTS